MHLFSGASGGDILKASAHPFEVLNIDLREDLASSSGAWIHLLKLIAQGKVYGVIGGPPRKTLSLCRHFPPGPLPLRTPAHYFGLLALSGVEKAQVAYDDALFLRKLFLHESAQLQLTMPAKPLFLLEQPADPAGYTPRPVLEQVDSRVARERRLAARQQTGASVPADDIYATFLRSPTWETFVSRRRAPLTTFDQGPLGHVKRKPTTIAADVQVCLSPLPIREGRVRVPAQGEMVGMVRVRQQAGQSGHQALR